MIGQQQRNNSDRNIDEENPAPVEIVGDPPAQRGTDRRRQHHGHAVNRESHAALSGFKRVGQDGLFAGLQTAAAGTLQNAEDDQRVRFGAIPHRNELIVNMATQDM